MAAALSTDFHIRRYEPEEIEAIVGARGHGELMRVAIQQRRSISAVRSKRYELVSAQKARAESGVFIPDNGLPYAVTIARLRREARVS